jgi:hypothetical protein
MLVISDSLNGMSPPRGNIGVSDENTIGENVSRVRLKAL